MIFINKKDWLNVVPKHCKAVSTMINKLNMGQAGNLSATPRKSSPRKSATKKSVSTPKDSVDINLPPPPPRFSFTTGNKVEALTDSTQSLAKIDKLISGAKDKVQVQMYRLGHNKIVDLFGKPGQAGSKGPGIAGRLRGLRFEGRRQAGQDALLPGVFRG